jgi:phosphoribosylformylglycinamidine synthase
VVTVHPENQKAFEDSLKGNTFAPVGRIIAGKDFTVIGLQGAVVIRADIFDLKETWKRPLRW